MGAGHSALLKPQKLSEIQHQLDTGDVCLLTSAGATPARPTARATPRIAPNTPLPRCDAASRSLPPPTFPRVGLLADNDSPASYLAKVSTWSGRSWSGVSHIGFLVRRAAQDPRTLHRTGPPPAVGRRCRAPPHPPAPRAATGEPVEGPAKSSGKPMKCRLKSGPPQSTCVRCPRLPSGWCKERTAQLRGAAFRV